MSKIIQFFLFLFILINMGIFFRDLHEKKAEKVYGMVSLKYPEKPTEIIAIKKTLSSKCEKWLKLRLEDMLKGCKDCEVTNNQCVDELPKNYVGVFEQEDIGVSYIYKPSTYPEVLVLEHFPEQGFGKICQIEKMSFNKAVCIETAIGKAANQPKVYAVIAMEYPEGVATLTSIKQVSISECNPWRQEYYQAMADNCKDCTFLINECSEHYPAVYAGVFEQKSIGIPYIYKPFLYPEVIIAEGSIIEAFDQLCEIGKGDFEKAVCIE